MLTYLVISEDVECPLKIAAFSTGVDKNAHHRRDGLDHVLFHVDVIVLQCCFDIRTGLLQQLVDMVQR